MRKALNVYLNQNLVGIYQQDISGHKSFTYTEEYLANPAATPLSNSIPLINQIFGDKVCHSFFGGILPEYHQRSLIAKILGVSENNDYSLLEKIGGECAGAISFFPENVQPAFTKREYIELSAQEVLHRINELATHPLLIGYDEMRLSLAGVQDKITVALNADKIYLPLYGSPSTHILKPEIGYAPSTVVNEAFCLKLAKLVGLNVADCEISFAEDKMFLLVKRYDRVGNYPDIARLHQEDFCQALGIASTNKYQSEGGPSIAQSFAMLRRISSNPATDLAMLLDGIIFNYIVGNCDAHGKNFSVMYKGTTVRLAPFYDILCTTAYPELANKMAMKIGSAYDINKVENADILKMAQSAELSGNLVLQRIKEIASLVIDKVKQIELPNTGIDQIRNVILLRAQKVLQKH